MVAHSEPSPPLPDSPRPPSRDRQSYLFPLALLLVIGAFFAIRAVRTPEGAGGGYAAGWRPSPRPEGPSVSLEVDYGNGARRSWAALPWTQGMSVLDALVAAAAFRPGLTYELRGTDQAALVTSIDGLLNLGDGGRNWLYSVDGERGDEERSDANR